MGTTVATQLKVPALLRRYGYRAVLAVGCVLLGPPSLAFLWSTRNRSWRSSSRRSVVSASAW